MVRFTAAEYADMVAVYGVAGGVAAEATLCGAYQRLREDNLLPRHGEVRPRRGDRVQVEEEILETVENSPELSVRGIASALGTTRSTVHRVLRVEGLHPWKYTPVQELKPEDFPKRVDFCQWLLDRSREPEVIRNVCWTDEKIFVRKGIVNQHNEHHWAFKNPRLTKETNFQYRWDHMNIWGGIIGDEVHIHHLPGRLDGGNYLGFLQDRLVNVIGDGHAERDVWFQHDGAPAHTCVAVVEAQNEWFPDRWIGKRSDRDRGGNLQPSVAWPPRSPDLTPLDFFLWGTLESRIYAHHPATQEEVVGLLHAAVASITPDQLEAMRGNLLRRARLCLDAGGGHVENLL
ncbi:uncharacterized protein [Fopius arisanus]|uniref:Tc1-like transposase DDE domain-containing protein n=1 Tax=Fopius arisanus TaxID=64838 RepID=A0A9R1TPK3_9HYME|nr:PREDICTED: uncharacterized protein LOC105272752 [Fopius arisanus]